MSAPASEIETFCPRCGVVNALSARTRAACTACGEPLRHPGAAAPPADDWRLAIQREPIPRRQAPVAITADLPEVRPNAVALSTAAFVLSVRGALGEPASRGNRLVAQLIDNGMLALIAAGAYFLVQPGFAWHPAEAPVLGLPAVAAVCWLAYQFHLLATTGQTVGKRLLDLCVVRCEDEGNAGFFRAVVLRSFVPAFLALLPGVGLAFLAIDVLFIFGRERRCLHDWIAGTKVINA